MRPPKGRGPRKGPKQSSRPSSRGSERKSKSESIKDKRQARGLKENAGKPSKRLEPRKNFGMRDKSGPMRKFGEKKASPQSNRARSHGRPKEGSSDGPKRTFSRSDERPSYGNSRERPSYGRSRDNDGPRRTFSRSSDDKPRRSYDRDGPKPDYRKPRENFRDGPRRTYNKSCEDKPGRSCDRERPKRTYGKPREESQDRPRRSYDQKGEDRPKRFSRKGSSRGSSFDKPEGRGRNMSNRARALKDSSMGFKKFSREPNKIKPKRREEYRVTCANCGKETDVPFKPTGIKPVLCRECYSKNKK